jgi:hypothetical protein
MSDAAQSVPSLSTEADESPEWTGDRMLTRSELRERGWTKTLIAKFLPRPDGCEPVNYWANFRGKDTYSWIKVWNAEQSEAFGTAFKHCWNGRMKGKFPEQVLRKMRKDPAPKIRPRAAGSKHHRRSFNLYGRGHEPRVHLNRSMAAILRGCDLPSIKTGGFGRPSKFFPTSIFVEARTNLVQRLGWSPFEISDTKSQGEVHLIEDQLLKRNFALQKNCLGAARPLWG